MRQKRLTGYRLAGVGAALLMLVFALTPASLKAQAQDQNQPAATANSQDSQDSKTDSNVMTALGSSKELENVAITTNTQGGVVTLTGVVRNEHQKQLAESLTAHAAGVNRVVNNLTIDAAPPQDAAAPAVPANTSSENGTPNTAVLMSDGSMSDGSNPADQNGPPQQDADNGGQPSVAGQPGDQQNGDQQNGPPQGPNGGYGPNGGRPPYGQNGYAQNAPPRRPPQVGGQQVVVQPGAMLRIRTLQTLDSRNLRAGTPFNAVVLNDVMAGGAIAIPRGASLQGTVIESKKAGAFGGRGKLVITLNSVSMGGQGYQIASDAWSNEGPSKTGRTVGNAIGLGAVGALIGAAAGGGPGAAIGAAAGGATGVAASGASPTMQAYIPAEAVLIFHLQRPLTVTTVGQEELNRLAQNVPQMQRQPQMRRGYYGGYPPPPPAYYGQYPY